MQLLSFQEALRRRSAVSDHALLATALEKLWLAYCYAIDAGVDAWDFAVEINEFRRADISNSELRWLLVRGYARHAEEITVAGRRRQLRQVAPTSLQDNSCFVITETGLALIEAWSATTTKLGTSTSETLPMRQFRESADSAPPSTSKEGPFWDAKQYKLWVVGNLVKQLRRPAPCLVLILDAFQTANWPAHIIDPLPLHPEQCPKRRLHDAIKRLNRGHRFEAIRFSGDGSGRGVLWKRIQ